MFVNRLGSLLIISPYLLTVDNVVIFRCHEYAPHPPLEMLPVCVEVQTLFSHSQFLYTQVSLEDDLCYHILMTSVECLHAEI